MRDRTFMCSVFTGTLTLMTGFLIVYNHHWLLCRLRVCASFLFGGDLNGHHQEWFGLTTTNRHGTAAFDFTTVSGCDRLVVGPIHARGGTLEH